MPKIVYFGAENRIEYTYDTAGIKLSKTVYKNDIPEPNTVFIGSYIYNDNASNLECIIFSEGRILPDP